MRQLLGGAIKFPDLVKLQSNTERIPIATYRCQTCGFLESYAREEFAVK